MDDGLDDIEGDEVGIFDVALDDGKVYRLRAEGESDVHGSLVAPQLSVAPGILHFCEISNFLILAHLNLT